MGYKYFDTPDGKDCGKKLLYLMKKSGIIGLFLSASNVILLGTPPTYGKILTRFAAITIPCVTIGAVSAASVCVLVGARDTDDQYNHLLGWFLGGLAGGVMNRNVGHGVAGGLLLGVLAAVYKHSKMLNYDLFLQDIKFNTEDHWTKDYDLRITKQRPKEWVAK